MTLTRLMRSMMPVRMINEWVSIAPTLVSKPKADEAAGCQIEFLVFFFPFMGCMVGNDSIDIVPSLSPSTQASR